MRTIAQSYQNICDLLEQLPSRTLRERLRSEFFNFPDHAEPSARYALNWLRQQPNLPEHIRLELITIRLES